MKTLAGTLCLALIALTLGCDGGQSAESETQRQLASSPEAGAETGAPAATGKAREPGVAGREEPRPEPERAEPSEPDAPPAAIAPGERLPRDLWIWPDPRAAEPDLDADLLDCSSRLAEDPALSARSDLAQLGWILDCMSGHGWARNPDFEPSRG
jgi:hypothetical protein